MPRSRALTRIWRPGLYFKYELEMIQRRPNANAVAAFELIERDLRTLFQYVEPSAGNLSCFSMRLYEVLLRACTEVESLFRLALGELDLGKDETMIRYSDFEGPMKLSEYVISIPGCDIPSFRPFESFSAKERSKRSPSWYRSYNSVKHNRYDAFSDASLANALRAAGGLYALLYAQIGDVNKVYATVIGAAQSKRQENLFVAETIPTWPDSECYEQECDVVNAETYDLPEIPNR